MAETKPNGRQIEPVPSYAPRQEAARALAELRDALRAHGVTLPSLDLDGVSLVASDLDPTRRPLVELGRANLATVRDLTAALLAGLVKDG